MAKISELPIVDQVEGDESIPMLSRGGMRRVTPAQISRLMDANPRAATLADAERTHFLVVKGGSYHNAGDNQAGAIKIGLPVGIDARDVTMRVLVRDHYGFLIFHIAGRNDGAWNYPSARVEGEHRIVAEHPVRFGNDGTRDCVWIGNPGYTYWDHLTVKVLEATFDGQVITEAWAGAWSTGLTTTIENVYVGPIPTHLPVTSRYLKVNETPKVGIALGPFASYGTRDSGYNVNIGYGNGQGLGADDFNIVSIGLQGFNVQSEGSSASTGVGSQVFQNAKAIINSMGYNIHAGLSLEYGDNFNALGAGAMEYAKNVSRALAICAYAGRDNQASDVVFLGPRAGMYSVDEAGAFHIAVNENESLLRGNFLTRYLNINGALASEGLTPLADNTYALGSASKRFSALYVASGQITTSDRRQKRDITDIPDEWLDAWATVERRAYRHINGDRWHVGLIAQEVHAAFAARGIDAFEIGLLCRDEWQEEREAVTRKKKVKVKKQRPRVVGGQVQLIDTGRVTNDNRPIFAPEMEDYAETIERLHDTGKTKVALPGGEIWGLRYAECEAMEAAYQRRRMDRLEAALAALGHAA